ncbi:MAG: SpoIIE family protein phosphatase [Bacteroidales bacterium]|nr:SpoIIE family protein phosphatase [Bacteroidales bacterium]MBN2698962.1 SpoIIE family protein phosphatase [Bacteroidales bacterium]
MKHPDYTEPGLNRETLLIQRRELLSSIKYASLIQRAVLPDPEYMSRVLHDHFILYMPRDIVSGDFYYVTKKDNFIVVAAGDCTGHGVPGALMSIMGISFLNEILSSRSFRKASGILNLLRERVMGALHQTGRNEENKEAIDMALCIFDTRSNDLQYAGANNSLYHIRKKVLTQIKADCMPVGVNAIEEESFRNHSLKLKKDDIVYIFSDGYADQFGGPEGKKFKYGPLKKLLIDISDKPMATQKEILEMVIRDWKGSEKQVDDILAFGIKFI